MTIFSGQSVISRVYTSRFGNGTSSHGTSTEVVLKKYQVPGTVPSGKPPKSEPYRAVPCSGKAPSVERATTIQRHMFSFKEGTARPLKAFHRILGLMAAASPVLQLGLLHMQTIQFWLKQKVPSTAWRHRRHRVTVTRACVSAVVRWREPFWLK